MVPNNFLLLIDLLSYIHIFFTSKNQWPSRQSEYGGTLKSGGGGLPLALSVISRNSINKIICYIKSYF